MSNMASRMVASRCFALYSHDCSLPCSVPVNPTSGGVNEACDHRLPRYSKLASRKMLILEVCPSMLVSRFALLFDCNRHQEHTDRPTDRPTARNEGSGAHELQNEASKASNQVQVQTAPIGAVTTWRSLEDPS